MIHFERLQLSNEMMPSVPVAPKPCGKMIKFENVRVIIHNDFNYSNLMPYAKHIKNYQIQVYL